MLMENKNLKCLDIDNNVISDNGIRDVSAGVQQNNTLTILRIGECGISVKGNYIHITNYCNINVTTLLDTSKSS